MSAFRLQDDPVLTNYSCLSCQGFTLREAIWFPFLIKYLRVYLFLLLNRNVHLRIRNQIKCMRRCNFSGHIFTAFFCNCNKTSTSFSFHLLPGGDCVSCRISLCECKNRRFWKGDKTPPVLITKQNHQFWKGDEIGDLMLKTANFVRLGKDKISWR